MDKQKITKIAIKSAVFFVIILLVTVISSKLYHKNFDINILADLIAAIFCAVVTEFIPPLGKKRQ